jgi:Leucine rich repeat variant
MSLPDYSLTEAAGAETSPNRLKELACSTDRAIRQAVASNPNTPADVLWELGLEFPTEVWKNPVLPLLEMVDPNFWEHIPRQMFCCLLACPAAWPVWLEQAAAMMEEDLQLAILANCALPETIFNKLMAHARKGTALSAALAVHSFSSPQVTQEFVELHLSCYPGMWGDGQSSYGRDEPNEELPEDLWKQGLLPEFMIASMEDELILKVANNPSTPANVLAILAKHEVIQVRQAVAANPETAPRVLEALSQDPEESVRRAVLNNPSTSLSVGERMLGENTDLRVVIARQPQGSLYLKSMEQQERLRQSGEGNIESPWVYPRYRLACSSTLNETMIHLLSEDPHPLVRVALAANPGIDETYIEYLAVDPNANVRGAIASRSNISNGIAKLLSQDKELSVRLSLIEGRHKSQSLVLESAKFSAIKRHTPQAELSELARHPMHWVRAAVAEHPLVTLELLISLSEDRDYLVRRAIAKHPEVPVEILRRIGQPDWRNKTPYALELAQNPSTPPDLLVQLAEHEDFQTKICVARHPATPVETLRYLARIENCHISTKQDIIESLVANPSTPADVLAQMLPKGKLLMERHRAAVLAHPRMAEPELMRKVIELVAQGELKLD